MKESVRLNLVPFLLVIGVCVLGQNITAAENSFNWDEFDALLKNHVAIGGKENIRSNLVDYKGLSSNSVFHQIGEQLKVFKPKFTSPEVKMAFYINAYNYFAIKVIIDNKPKNSIRDIGSILSPVWKKKVGQIGGEPVSLDGIEHGVLMKMKEPRLHFALVCASLSCPDLRKEVYRAKDLEKQLEEQVKVFLFNGTKGLKVAGGELIISRIFDWYEDDFGGYNGVLSFVQKYRPELKEYDSYDVFDYNWSLNTQ